MQYPLLSESVRFLQFCTTNSSNTKQSWQDKLTLQPSPTGPVSLDGLCLFWDYTLLTSPVWPAKHRNWKMLMRSAHWEANGKAAA